jgi:hypothetical protein
MNISEQYRSSMEYREILRILQRSSATPGNILWQSSVLGKNIIPIHYFEIDFIAREVVIKFDDETYKIDSEIPLYIKLSYRDTVFKVSNFRRKTDSLHFTFPEIVKSKELRRSQRVFFKQQQEKFVTLKPAVHSGQKDFGNEFKVRVCDISDSGIGLIVSEQNRNFLKNNRILWVTGLQNEMFDGPIVAEIVYMNSDVDHAYQVKKQKQLKVGLKISGNFPVDSFSRFIQ